jgi:hypothetical protein
MITVFGSPAGAYAITWRPAAAVASGGGGGIRRPLAGQVL